MANRSNDSVAVAVTSDQPCGPTQALSVIRKNKDSDAPPRRRSSRDMNSIRLAGSHTFYRRLRTLFFSDPSQKEFETLLSNGSRRRKSSKKNTNCAKLNRQVSTIEKTSREVKPNEIASTVDADMHRNPKHRDVIQVERATKPEDPAIYVIDNFLTESELEYFDKKIASISFERSYVDNMENDDDDDQNDTGNRSTQSFNTTAVDGISDRGDQECQVCDSVDKHQIPNEIPSQIKNQNLLAVDCDDTSTSALNYNKEIKINNMKKRRGTKNKKRKRKSVRVIDDSQRTSTFFSFRKLHDSKISALEQRVANILGCWVHQIEALQLVRYLPGQFFGIHHDMGNLLEDDTVQLPRKNLACKRRLVTIFCYLNTLRDEEGGCTYFPKCGDLRVRPRRGRAVFWCNVTEDGKADSRTIHAGEAVKSKTSETESSSSKDFGESQCRSENRVTRSGSKKDVETTKYGLNIWVCEE